MDALKLATSRFGEDYKRATKEEIRYNCPFCLAKRGKENTDLKLYVNTKTGKFFCFKCHSRGRLIKDVESSYGVYDDILNLEKSKGTEDGHEDNVFYIPTLDIRKSGVAMEYCLSRGISEDIIDYYDMRLGVDDLFGRIVIPNLVFGENRIWTDMYSGRSYIGQEPKYRNPPDCRKEDVVFNLHRIKDNTDVIYVNEGAITAIMAGKEAVAVYGSYPSDRQVSLIVSKNPKSIICTLDNDRSGQHGNKALLEKFSNVYKGDLYEVIMPPETDAADMGEEKYKEYVEMNKIRYFGSVYSRMFSHVFNGKTGSN